ncbi:MAG TPA: kelch repeat-containing protein [Verrucomicrobiae bacterium]|nr:kelch repeat-containing protein [Verrucomicrobiae bacterium]
MTFLPKGAGSQAQSKFYQNFIAGFMRTSKKLSFSDCFKTTTRHLGRFSMLLTALLLNVFLALQGRADYFTNAASMNLPRVGHTATLLLNGKVLVTGGHNDTGTINNESELYNPTDGMWNVTGSMATQRVVHASVLLTSGKVLTSGGLSIFYNGYLSSAEVYDPATEKWTATGSMNAARFNHTATLLANGYVLITGGDGTNGYASGAEIYNPSMGTWTPTNGLNIPRDSHTATLLPNGKVLVTGGYNGGNLSSAELYDPTTGTWRVITPMTYNRVSHTATLLQDGQVLVAGGFGNVGPYLISAELFNPTNETWRLTRSLSVGRYNHSATLLPNGKVLVVGGYGPGPIPSAEVYDPATETWTVACELNIARCAHTATLLPNTNVLVAGGVVGIYQTLSNAELFVSGSLSAAPIILTNLVKTSGGPFEFDFISAPGTSFTALAATNIALPVGNWTVLGSVPEINPGQYRFTDAQANTPQRFYRVRSP